jgi:hydroxypyruvate reductase
MLTPESFATHTLAKHPHGSAVMRILHSAIHAVEPGNAVRKFARRKDRSLFVNGHEIKLDQINRIEVLGLGKASQAMTEALIGILDDPSVRGLVIPKHNFPSRWSGIDIQPGDHPVPDRNSLSAGINAKARAQTLNANDLLISLVSGGGSALMTYPHEGIALSDLQQLTSMLLACGARIAEINTLRRHLDQLKGGGIARLASPARVISLILSDVVGNPLEAIASGPTAPDPSTREDALSVLQKYNLLDKVSASISAALEQQPETPKPGDAIFDRVQNVIVGSNALAAQSAMTQARAEGFAPQLLGNDWQGEARDVSQQFCKLIRAADRHRPFCLIAGGETTVTLRGHGRGGRNQEFALAAVRELAKHPNTLLITLATDGEDGPTDAAGAVVSSETLWRGELNGLLPEAFLENNDAYTYFSALDDLIKPGATGTNVNDLMFLIGG